MERGKRKEGGFTAEGAEDAEGAEEERRKWKEERRVCWGGRPGWVFRSDAKDGI